MSLPVNNNYGSDQNVNYGRDQNINYGHQYTSNGGPMNVSHNYSEPSGYKLISPQTPFTRLDLERTDMNVLKGRERVSLANWESGLRRQMIMVLSAGSVRGLE
ncbi:hypothetical protein V5O48_015985 [Marasmius crinis-equi]|uniref:Uncharacterized protein n=1 Tax=Marasmius crinis-equi TaxID=585013 RepID=A0ABR3ET91_9AGAR